MIEISKEEAQKFILSHQLLQPKNSPKNIDAIFNQIHNVQIDTISVVARSHDIILFNRLPNYNEKDIWKAQKEKKVFEFWSHKMCFVPMHSFPFYAWKMDHNIKYPQTFMRTWRTEYKSVIENTLKHVKKNGPTKSTDFQRKDDRKREGWWDWKEEKIALEYLLMIGKVLISHRSGFQKYYDLTENVLPNNINQEPITDKVLPEELVKLTFNSIGLGSIEDLKLYLGLEPAKFLWKGNRRKITEYLDSCVEEKLLEKVQIENASYDYYIPEKLTSEVLKNDVNFDSNPVLLINPFDNLMRDRHYLLDIWGFNYLFEAYVPEAKRQFGYFMLPIIDGQKIIGQLDPKVHRSDKILEIKSLFIVDNYKPTDDALERFKQGITKFAEFHACEKIIFNKITPSHHQQKIAALFS
ncbi:MAG: winged helix-turn-helix domain-containing protein [Asgard group archaeon]|nr:winged helix-turn-helix domain-containing protein [Asgard group archaeon]